MATETVNITTTLADDSVTNAQLAEVAEATIKGRPVGAGTGNPQDLTADKASVVLDTATDPFLRTSALPVIEVPTTLATYLTLTNMPNALHFLASGIGQCSTIEKLTNYTQIKLVMQVSINSPAPFAKVILRYRADGYNDTPGNYSDIGTSEVSLSLATYGTSQTAWIDIAPGAKANDISIRLLGQGGNGTADPVVGTIIMYKR